MSFFPTYQRSVRNFLVLTTMGIIFVSIVPSHAASTEPSKGAKANTGKIKWLKPAAGLKLSKATGKPILYDFTAHWCGWCKVLDAKIFEKPEYAAKINRLYVPVVVMDEQREKGENSSDVVELQSRYQIQGFPTLVVQYPNGESRQLVGFNGESKTADFLTQTTP